MRNASVGGGPLVAGQRMAWGGVRCLSDGILGGLDDVPRDAARWRSSAPVVKEVWAEVDLARTGMPSQDIVAQTRAGLRRPRGRDSAG